MVALTVVRALVFRVAEVANRPRTKPVVLLCLTIQWYHWSVSKPCRVRLYVVEAASKTPVPESAGHGRRGSARTGHRSRCTLPNPSRFQRSNSNQPQRCQHRSVESGEVQRVLPVDGEVRVGRLETSLRGAVGDVQHRTSSVEDASLEWKLADPCPSRVLRPGA